MRLSLKFGKHSVEIDRPGRGDKYVYVSDRLREKPLMLSKRVKNCLLNAGVETIDDITKLSHREVVQIRGMGMRTVRDLEYCLRQTGRKLRPVAE